MLVSIGTRSTPKIIAITRAFSHYPELWLEKEDGIEYTIMPKEVRNDEKVGKDKDNFSGVSCNPMSLSETINGAKNRAKNAYDYAKATKGKCDFGVGIEARNV
ncbi:MAG: DUF84 family protein [Clostridiales bacterium]|nr:DUF84 family protein [Clostridiales bacterium]